VLVTCGTTSPIPSQRSTCGSPCRNCRTSALISWTVHSQTVMTTHSATLKPGLSRRRRRRRNRRRRRRSNPRTLPMSRPNSKAATNSPLSLSTSSAAKLSILCQMTASLFASLTTALEGVSTVTIATCLITVSSAVHRTTLSRSARRLPGLNDWPLASRFLPPDGSCQTPVVFIIYPRPRQLRCRVCPLCNSRQCNSLLGNSFQYSRRQCNSLQCSTVCSSVQQFNSSTVCSSVQFTTVCSSVQQFNSLQCSTVCSSVLSYRILFYRHI
jgi:hypothetical protein